MSHGRRPDDPPVMVSTRSVRPWRTANAPGPSKGRRMCRQQVRCHGDLDPPFEGVHRRVWWTRMVTVDLGHWYADQGMSLLRHLPGCRLPHDSRGGPNALNIAAEGRRDHACCPACRTRSSTVHSRTQRRAAGLIGGRARSSGQAASRPGTGSRPLCSGRCGPRARSTRRGRSLERRHHAREQDRPLHQDGSPRNGLTVLARHTS